MSKPTSRYFDWENRRLSLLVNGVAMPIKEIMSAATHTHDPEIKNIRIDIHQHDWSKTQAHINTNQRITMEFKTYTHKPYDVEAVEITLDNIDEVAAIIGIDGEVNRKNEKPFIMVDRRKVRYVYKVTTGWFLTHMNGTYRCFSPTAFADQFDAIPLVPVSNVFDQEEVSEGHFDHITVLADLPTGDFRENRIVD